MSFNSDTSINFECYALFNYAHLYVNYHTDEAKQEVIRLLTPFLDNAENISDIRFDTNGGLLIVRPPFLPEWHERVFRIPEEVSHGGSLKGFFDSIHDGVCVD
jgi:hypothetical protein